MIPTMTSIRGSPGEHEKHTTPFAYSPLSLGTSKGTARSGNTGPETWGLKSKVIPDQYISTPSNHQDCRTLERDGREKLRTEPPHRGLSTLGHHRELPLTAKLVLDMKTRRD